MIQSVKVKNLSLSKDNVRKSNRDLDIESFAATIAAHGLLQNLVVTPLKKNGHFTVKAGGRRLRALQHLIATGVLPADHEVPALVLADDADSTEASLAENFGRLPMNPADEATAFNHFIDKGASAEDVAKRFGVTTRFVEQRVRLAELAPCIFQALAAGEISLGVAQAYAVTGDTDRQARVFEQMKSAYYGNQPDNIRRAILNGTVKANDAKARFVGRDAYLAAGGRIEGDLFATEGDENWIDVELLEDMAAQKLEAAAAELAESQGLAFVTPVAATHVPYDTERQLHEYHATARPLSEAEQERVDALAVENDTLVDQLETELVDGTDAADAANARLEEIERELDELDAARKVVDPEVRAQLGTFVYIGGDGTVRVHTRMFSEKPVVDPNAPVVISPIGGADDVGEQGVKLSATLVDELATQRRQILVAHLASDPALALDLTIFLMAQDVVFANNYVRSHSTLKASPSQFPIFAFRDEGSLASQTIADQRQALDTSWAGHDTMSARFDAFRALDDEARGNWVAFVIAQTLEPTLNAGDGGRLNGFHDHLGRILDIQVEQWWRPTAANFFGRVKKDVMLDALEDIGGPILRGRYKDAKKGDLASTCASLCNGQGIVEAEIREKATAWLPDAMRFDAIEKPERYPTRSAFLEAEDDEDVEAVDDALDGEDVEPVGEITDDDDLSEAA
ncbi:MULTISPECIES: ParB/RepB/Spo0J family partition protein [Sphingobium]|jgi:ParB family chromosome partitioning protein|uniref:ParB/RepB/Spo0J family partition protein n=1 Tax=Sphingobium TaxID=165695 RepID=UPI0004E4380A|nr:MULTISPECIES: ParB/RepB/Spo0J family partition protein [Sphingobium]KFD27635.1 chromosome partitioning protein ParB [Sphingobium yanoikuyae]MDV3481496.1 ParB N-terminal domain-containing protein [Sphingobium yanoikuyae]OAN56798.1 chromosome partitioning protein ParB [Sphingobium sp. TCM1]PHP17083.1 chromosome partitioning protein ParB [Sphingobium sp. IP1]TKV43994.1 chromosome partitioning protein ParB [Sphingobium sp. MP9-4]